MGTKCGHIKVDWRKPGEASVFGYWECVYCEEEFIPRSVSDACYREMSRLEARVRELEELHEAAKSLRWHMTHHMGPHYRSAPSEQEEKHAARQKFFGALDALEENSDKKGTDLIAEERELEKENEELREYISWILHLNHGVSKDGKTPTHGEWDDCLEAGIKLLEKRKTK